MKINIGVLPWIGLDTAVQIGRVTFVPWSKYRDEVTDVDLRSHIDAYISIYKGKSQWEGKWSEVHPMIALLDDNLHIPKEESDVFFRTVNLLFLLMTAWDNLSYINSNCLEAFLQPLVVGKYTLGGGPRRSITIYSDFRELIITEPLHISAPTRAFGIVQFDEYKKALTNLQASKEYGALADAVLNFYRLAYDDNYASNDYLKISYIISAVETLLEGDREKAVKEVAARVPSKKSGVVWNVKTKKEEGSTLPAEVIDRAYNSRNGYLHKGAMRGISLIVDGEEIPLWDCAIHVFQKLFLSKLEEWKLLEWNQFLKHIVFTNDFDKKIDSIVQNAKGHREWREKKAAKK